MSTITFTSTDAADLFRAPPKRLLDMGPGNGAVGYRTVGSGPDVVFVHGWPVTSATFRTVLPHLVDHVTCHLLDLPGAGSSRFDASTNLTIDNHIASVVTSIDQLGLDSVAVVGHDSGGLIARHAMAGDVRLRAMGLINTEPPANLSWRFRSFIAARHLPGFGAGFGWVAGARRIRRIGLVLGDAFADASLLDGEFDEFFLQPLHTSAKHRAAAVQLLRSLRKEHLTKLGALHDRIDVPVRMVWGDQDPFFPIAGARNMVRTFANADLVEIRGAGLFSHEERPTEVAAALLPVLTS